MVIWHADGIQAALLNLYDARRIPTRLHSVLERLRRTSTLRRVDFEHGWQRSVCASVETLMTERSRIFEGKVPGA